MLGLHSYSGGILNDIGTLQVDFLISRGLRPSHNFVHVGCGSLRSGVHFIRYLNTGCYCGMDKERDLVQRGISKELGLALFKAKRPLFIVTDRFAFECCDTKPDFALAQSLFTRLAPSSIALCLDKLRTRIRADGIFYATFGEARIARANPPEAHGNENFYYTRSEMEDFGKRNGWVPTYIGEWDHPNNEMMIAYRPASIP